MDIIKFCCLLLVFLSNLVSSGIYKCVSDSGNIKYQSTKCNSNDQSKVMVIKNPPRQVSNKKPTLKKESKLNPIDDYEKGIASEIEKNQKKQKRLICSKLKKRLKIAEKKVIDKCKKHRNTFCNLSAIQIEKNERQLAISQIQGSYGGGSATIPRYSQVEIIHQEYKKQGCR
jgi:hypothetical protein